MNKVTQLTHSVDRDQITRLFTELKARYSHAFTSIASSDTELEFTIDIWLEELSKFTLGQLYRAKSEAYLIYKKFPPNLGELVELCLKACGVPDIGDVIRMMVDRKIDHPIAKLVYDKIGAWKLSNGTEKEIKELASIAYHHAVIAFTREPEFHWKRLQDFQDIKAKQLPAPEKIPTPTESKAFEDCMAKCRELIGVNTKGEDEIKPCREFDEAAISQTNRAFDQKTYDEFREYLLSIPEEMTSLLPATWSLKRMKFLAAKEQPEYLRKAGFNPNPQVNNSEPPRRTGGPSRVYRDFHSYN